MRHAVRHLWLGLLLIVLASVMLLLSDLESRVVAEPEPGPAAAAVDEPTALANEDLPPVPPNPRAPEGEQFTIGLAYFAPDRGAEEAMAGLFDGLRDLGYEEGVNLKVLRNQAAGEINLVPQVLQNLDASPAQAIVTFTTPVLVGALNTVRSKPVVFTHVVDPIAAGAGTSFDDHNPNVTGVGSFPPLDVTLDFFGYLRSDFSKLGVVYNPGEANSSAVVQKLGELCAERGWALETVTVTNSSEVGQAAQALAGKKPNAIYVPGDNTVYQALDAVLSAGTAANVPVVIDAPDLVASTPGVLAGVGVGHYFAGKAAALPLAQVLLGAKPSQIPLQNISSERVRLNTAEAEKLGIKWSPFILQMQAMTQDPPGLATSLEAQQTANADAHVPAPAP